FNQLEFPKTGSPAVSARDYLSNLLKTMLSVRRFVNRVSQIRHTSQLAPTHGSHWESKVTTQEITHFFAKLFTALHAHECNGEKKLHKTNHQVFQEITGFDLVPNH